MYIHQFTYICVYVCICVSILQMYISSHARMEKLSKRSFSPTYKWNIYYPSIYLSTSISISANLCRSLLKLFQLRYRIEAQCSLLWWLLTLTYIYTYLQCMYKYIPMYICMHLRNITRSYLIIYICMWMHMYVGWDGA